MTTITRPRQIWLALCSLTLVGVFAGAQAHAWRGDRVTDKLDAFGFERLLDALKRPSTRRRNAIGRFEALYSLPSNAC